MVQSETNAHLETYLYTENLTTSGSAALTVIATNPGNAPIEINRIEAFSGIMSDSENDVGFDRVLQPGSSTSKFFLVPKESNGPPALTIEFLYKGVEQGKSEKFLKVCRFDVNKTSPIKIAIYPMDCQQSIGNDFVQPQERVVTFKIADQPEGAMSFVIPEIAPNGSPNVFIYPTASKLLVFNPIEDFAVFVCADGPGKPKVLTEKFQEIHLETIVTWSGLFGTIEPVRPPLRSTAKPKLYIKALCIL